MGQLADEIAHVLSEHLNGVAGGQVFEGQLADEIAHVPSEHLIGVDE